jgi:hypothetical protein
MGALNAGQAWIDRHGPSMGLGISRLIFSDRVRFETQACPQFEPVALFLRRQGHVHYLPHRPLLFMAGYDHCPQAQIKDQQWQQRASRATCATPRCGSPALNDDERAARDIGQYGQRIGEGDGRGDGDGADDGSGHFSHLSTVAIAGKWFHFISRRFSSAFD